MARQILIIDDDEDDCDLFCDAVSTVDSTVECEKVYGGESAMELLNSDYKPDIIFLDLNMPMFDGKKCLMEIGKTEALAGIPVVIYTTSKRAADKEETRRLGAVHFITKPSLLIELRAQIAYVLDKNWSDSISN